jgi:mRNA interferase HicA
VLWESKNFKKKIAICMKRKEFERHLKKNGCELLREGSNHSIWVNTLNDIQTSVPRHPEIVNITC